MSAVTVDNVAIKMQMWNQRDVKTRLCYKNHIHNQLSCYLTRFSHFPWVLKAIISLSLWSYVCCMDVTILWHHLNIIGSVIPFAVIMWYVGAYLSTSKGLLLQITIFQTNGIMGHFSKSEQHHRDWTDALLYRWLQLMSPVCAHLWCW